jgi:RNA ligase
MFKLSDALYAIKNKPEFSVKDKGSYTVIDYHVNSRDTFIGSTEEESRILLNLRGTAFDNESGDIIRLGFHKFFNYGEFPESDKTLDFSSDHIILKKLDGSCIFPIRSRNGILFGTRAGVTDVSLIADELIKSSSIPYIEFSEGCVHTGFTPIFELCTRQNRVVIDHPEPKLVLIGIRSMITGKYLTHKFVTDSASFYGIPCVEKYDSLSGGSQLPEFLTKIANLENDEGVVIRFSDDHMIKIKSDEYCLKHKALDQLRFAKDVAALHLKGLLDDIYPILDEGTTNRVRAYVDDLSACILIADCDILAEFNKFENIVDRKDFALAIKDSKYKSFLFKLKTDTSFDVYSMLIEFCIKGTSTQASMKELELFLGMKVSY